MSLHETAKAFELLVNKTFNTPEKTRVSNENSKCTCEEFQKSRALCPVCDKDEFIKWNKIKLDMSLPKECQPKEQFIYSSRFNNQSIQEMIDIHQLDPGTHFWATDKNHTLVACIKTKDGIYVCGPWECSIGEEGLIVVSIIPFPEGFTNSDLYYTE